MTTKADVIATLNNCPYLGHIPDGKKTGWWTNKHTYYLSHGEYSAPKYVPRKYGREWGIHVEYYYYPGTIYALESGRYTGATW